VRMLTRDRGSPHRPSSLARQCEAILRARSPLSLALPYRCCCDVRSPRPLPRAAAGRNWTGGSSSLCPGRGRVTRPTGGRWHTAWHLLHDCFLLGLFTMKLEATYCSETQAHFQPCSLSSRLTSGLFSSGFLAALPRNVCYMPYGT
jgi:hypothetical protein